MAIIGILLVGIAAFFYFLAFVHVLLTALLYARLYFKGGTMKNPYESYVKAGLVAVCVALGSASIWAIHALNAFA